MRDRRSGDAFAHILTIREAQRAGSRQHLFDSAAAEDRALAARRHADAEADAAAAGWQDHLARGTFDPDLARLLAHEMVERDDASRDALATEREAGTARRTREAEWHADDARCRQAARSLKDHRRALARRREERLLERDADRVTFAWTRA